MFGVGVRTERLYVDLNTCRGTRKSGNDNDVLFGYMLHAQKKKNKQKKKKQALKCIYGRYALPRSC